MVDINKVYRALSKLKNINPIYSQINLPELASDLNLSGRITECVVTDPSDDCDSDTLRSLSRGIARISEEGFP